MFSKLRFLIYVVFSIITCFALVSVNFGYLFNNIDISPFFPGKRRCRIVNTLQLSIYLFVKFNICQRQPINNLNPFEH